MPPPRRLFGLSAKPSFAEVCRSAVLLVVFDGDASNLFYEVPDELHQALKYFCHLIFPFFQAP
jgi:hypothetical protein